MLLKINKKNNKIIGGKEYLGIEELNLIGVGGDFVGATDALVGESVGRSSFVGALVGEFVIGE